MTSQTSGDGFRATGGYLLMTAILGPAILLLLTCSTSAQEQKALPRCNAVTLAVSLNAGDGYRRRINGLTFQVRAEQQKEEGWMFYIVDDAGRDFIYPVNPPIRFNPSQILGPGYGMSARKSLEWNRELRFLLNQFDYERIHPLLVNALWPYSAPNPDQAAEQYLSALANLRPGLLRVKIVGRDVASDDAVRAAKLQVEFIAPSDFHFDPSLEPRPTACPAQPPPL
jgi:hypothetical protein